MQKTYYSWGLVGLGLIIFFAVAGTSSGMTVLPLPVSINLNLGEPTTLDPSLATDQNSVRVVEQLFIGLFDLGDDTGEPVPELVTSWNVSPDGRVYTFTLRDDVYWTDGNPVTAHDAAYGILRALDPATMANYAYVLYLIENGQAYNQGSITDPNLVGVEALNDTTLVITLESSGVHILSILGLWVARPLPEGTIATYGSAWTEPGNIVTNGAYELEEWVSEDHILLEKSATYYAADQVQIDQVWVSMEEPATAWNMYLNGQLDTVSVPLGTSITDPALAYEVRRKLTNCTYYYGFINNKPPMDDARVRQAFAMSINKQGLINNALSGGPTAADHLGPPGNWGAPEIGEVGLGYNPTAARGLFQDYLTEQGMTVADFNALGISLMHNTSTGHALIAAVVAQMWSDTLGVEVTISDEPWADYLQRIQKSTPLADVPHIFRNGFCGDYPDENNWVHDLMNNQAGANRLRRGCLDDVCTSEVPLAFDLLTQQAQGEQDPVTRTNLYLQAEQLLAETEAAYIPLYFYGEFVATKPYLDRTYPTFGIFDISTWRNQLVSEIIEVAGGSLTSYDESTTIEIPAGAYTDTIILTQGPTSYYPPGANQIGIDHIFGVTAVYSDTSQTAALAPGQTFTMTVTYDQGEVGAAIEATLGLHYWDNGWVAEPSSSLDTAANTIVVTPNHLSVWAVLGNTNHTFLPVGLRQHP